MEKKAFTKTKVNLVITVSTQTGIVDPVQLIKNSLQFPAIDDIIVISVKEID